ncbi:putative ubiquitin fusion degradation protein [Podospora australis]|uniref:Ubiquitin fusion degradation protein n=1 Tax=Podospora australis TaxID=1536484 RepID=A0AAN6WT50_9PEZI|nr:putative ubiquitin fusion degradation protein [Podospora australis]
MADQPPQLNWSASLKVAHPSSVASKGLQGDKILLPQSALEQLLAASTITGFSTAHTFTAFDAANPYSVADARRERSQYRETHQQLPHPLMFQLVNPKNGNAVFAGIREFSANEGEVALSPYLIDALGIHEDEIQKLQFGNDDLVDLTADEEVLAKTPGVQITVKARQLPKGTYVRLRPLEAGYNPDDWKSLLERQLRASFTTLTRDSMLSVRGVKGEEFQFLTDKFVPEGNGICVVDTDLEVDIEPLNEEQAKETLRQIAAKSQRAPGTAAGSSVGHKMDIWKDVEGQVLGGDYVDYELPSWDKARPIAIELTIHDDHEIDIFISPKSNRQRALPREGEHMFGDFSSPRDGVKSIVIQPTNVELEGAESLLVSVHGFVIPNDTPSSTPGRYTIRAKAFEPGTSVTEPIELSSPPPQSADEEQCKNCLQMVPKRTIVLHENFCLRNNIVCPQCKNVFQKRSLDWENHWHCPTHPEAYGSTSRSKEKHDYFQHTSHTCASCGTSTPFTFPSLPELSRHRTTICPHKLILCHFCHLEVAQEGDPLDPSSEAETVLSGLTAHERADGARTTDCHLCGAIVRLRDMAAHSAHHELDKSTRSKPEVCRDELCGRTLHGIGPRGQVNGGTRMGQGPGNSLGLCSLCFAPLYVNMHDPEGKALRRRIERRYLTQLMTGCGKKWCQNEWCKTGRSNRGLEPLGTSAAAALPLVKPLLEAINDHSQQMHFCVDETSQRRKKTADMLSAEGVWDLEWCIASMEAEGGNLNSARTWLADWAPSKLAR